MKISKIVCILVMVASTAVLQAQELNARVTVNSSRVNNTVNKRTFQTLQNALNTFVNNRLQLFAEPAANR